MQKRLRFWRRFLYWFILRVYFARIAVLNRSGLPRSGPVLYLGLHRNGAVDGFVYHQALGGPTFMISTQLRKNWFARLFFTGIAVTRRKDQGDRGANAEALQECLNHLRAGGSLVVFPEGTSSLGPRHLPFKMGATWLILEYLEAGGPPLQVVPVGIHYECPWAFRAKVEVVVGEPINPTIPPGLGSLEKLKQLKQRVRAALEGVGINVPSEEDQGRIQRLAYVSTLATTRSYFGSLQTLQRGIPEPILQEATLLESNLRGRRLLLHQGVPLVPMGPVATYVLALVLLAPIVIGAILLNWPPFLAGWLAGNKFADGQNVVSLWKVLVGIPAFFLWICLVALLCVCGGKPMWFGLYAILTWTGLQLYYRFKKLLVAVHNALRYPKLRSSMLRFREAVLQNLPTDHYAT